MFRPFIEAYGTAWRKAKVVYHVAAFLSLVLVVALIWTHRVSGYTQANLAFGQDDLAAQVAAANTPLPIVQPRKAEKHAAAEPVPGEKPPVPPTPAQVGK
jgi:hypothetical protein